MADIYKLVKIITFCWVVTLPVHTNYISSITAIMICLLTLFKIFKSLISN